MDLRGWRRRDRRWRRAAPDPGRDPAGRQRRALQRARHADPLRGGPGGGSRRARDPHPGPGRGGRDRAGGSAAHLRALLPDRSRPRVRLRPGPADRIGHRRGPRRGGAPGVPARPRLDLHPGHSPVHGARRCLHAASRRPPALRIPPLRPRPRRPEEQPEMRILIAEDEPRIARFVERGLRANGYACTVVEDGISARDLASSGDFDLLILDVGLPRMDGFQVLKALRAMDVQIPILMVTARTGVEDTVQGLEDGANDYIAKHFRFEELLARVKLRAREATSGAGAVSSDVLTLGDLRLDLRTRIATFAGDPAPGSGGAGGTDGSGGAGEAVGGPAAGERSVELS